MWERCFFELPQGSQGSQGSHWNEPSLPLSYFLINVDQHQHGVTGILGKSAQPDMYILYIMSDTENDMNSE